MWPRPNAAPSVAEADRLLGCRGGGGGGGRKAGESQLPWHEPVHTLSGTFAGTAGPHQMRFGCRIVGLPRGAGVSGGLPFVLCVGRRWSLWRGRRLASAVSRATASWLSHG